MQSVVGRVGVSYFKGSLEQIFGKVVNWIFRQVLADINKAVSQNGDYIVHKVLPDWLRTSVEKISFLFLDLLKASASVGFLLLPYILFLVLVSVY
jgi:hypothetical protein